MPTPTFWTEPTKRERRWLRRYVSTHEGAWTCEAGWHHAKILLGDGPAGEYEPDPAQFTTGWPVECETGCGYQFTDDDHRQVFTSRIYVRPDTGEEWPMRDLPAGAMYDAYWMGDWAGGPDGICLMVMLPVDPSHAWMVDGEASNCTRKGDRSHKCWVRHGDPRTEPVTVNKTGGATCEAGGGSIAVDGYHGFLTNGELS